MKFIKKSSVDTVIEEARIYDVVSDSEELKKQGAHWFCKSPWTDDKTPSLCVQVVKNFFFDNSAGFGGNAITFLMKRHNLSFYEAIERAASICNITLEYEEQSEDLRRMMDEEKEMEKVVQFAAEQYQKSFHGLPEDHWVKQMVQERGYDAETIQAFLIGYAPDVTSFITSPLIEKAKYDYALHVGLTKTNEGKSYDFFRNRLMFPIHNDRGTIIGFGGRLSNEAAAEKKFAKYLNPIESRLYVKTKVLYGFFQAKKKIAELREAVLVEGYTDVISLHKAGLNNTVAPCGTALTDSQVKLLGRVAKTVIIFTDGDAAGNRAMLKDINLLLAGGLNVYVCVCPEGEDPDTLSRQCNVAEFIEKNKQDAVMFKAKLLKQQAANGDTEATVEALKKSTEDQIKEIRALMHEEEAFKSKELSPIDKKFMKKENQEWFGQIQELERELRDTVKDLPKFDPVRLGQAVEDMAVTLYCIKDSIIRGEYLKRVGKILETRTGTLLHIINSHEEKEKKEREKRSEDNQKKESDRLKLPEGANANDFLEDRFCVAKNIIYFQSQKTADFFPGTNHRYIPLFHIEGKQDNKRICEVVNVKGHRRLIDFDSTDLINFTKVREILVQAGHFFWEPGTSNEHFHLVMKKLLDGFITATELKLLGHQREGFYAFANGVYHQKNFKPVNEYGIVEVDGLKATESVYRSDIKHFYSPSHSEIYKHSREDDDPYENDRCFVYKPAPVTLEQWMVQMVKVWGDKGIFAIAMCFATNFRDLFIKNWNYFPLIGGFGQKDSGKSGYGVCVQSFFYVGMDPFDLNTGTLPGLSRRLSRVRNTIVFLDEYRDDIDEDKKQAIKGIWNGMGREKAKGTTGTQTTTDKINSTAYVSGQYWPAADDGAMPSRMVGHNFENKEFTAEEKEEYGKLMTWSKAGLTSFVTNVISYREYVEENIKNFYSETTKALKESLQGVTYQNRIFENYMVPLAVVNMLQSKFQFPFKYDHYFSLTRQAIIDNSDMVAESDGLTKFWRMIEYLANPDVKVLKHGSDFEIEKSLAFDIMENKQKIKWTNKNRDFILFLNFNKVHQEYHKEASRRNGEDILSATVVRNYLKSKKNYFIGMFPAKRMGNVSTSGYAFNYTEMMRLGIVSLPSEAVDAAQVEIEFNKPKKHRVVTNPATDDKSQTSLTV